MTAKQIFISIGIFLLAFLFGLLVEMPVTQLFRVINQPAQVQLQGLQGTVFIGKIDRLQVQSYPLSQIQYSLSPTCFFKLALCYQVLSDEEGLDLKLQYSLLGRGISLKDSNIELPASFFDTIPNLPVKPAGQFAINIENLQLDSDLRLEDFLGHVVWSNAGVQGEDQVIGDYRADIKPSDDGIDVALSDQDSLLGLKGNIKLNWQGGYDADLELLKRNGLNPSIINIMDMLAKKSGLNQYRIKQKGRLSVNISSSLTKFAPIHPK